MRGLPSFSHSMAISRRRSRVSRVSQVLAPAIQSKYSFFCEGGKASKVLRQLHPLGELPLGGRSFTEVMRPN